MLFSDSCPLQVVNWFKENCPTSPCAKDFVRKRLGPTIYMIGRTLIMSGTYKSMYDEFKADNASQFKPVKPQRI